MYLITWTYFWTLFRYPFELIRNVLYHNNNNACKLFAEIHVSRIHVTLWHSVVCQTWIEINYLSTVSLTIELLSLYHTSGKPQSYFDRSMYWYKSLTGIFMSLNFFDCPSFTKLEQHFYLENQPHSDCW